VSRGPTRSAARCGRWTESLSRSTCLTSATSWSSRGRPPRSPRWRATSGSTPRALCATATPSWRASTRGTSDRPRDPAYRSARRLARPEHELVAFGGKVAKPAFRSPIQRSEVYKAELFCDAPARVVLAACPQRQPRRMQLLTGPLDKSARRLRRAPVPCMIRADPVVKLGRSPAFEVQAGDAEREVRSFFDHREGGEAISAPVLFVASRQRDIALQRGLARPRHPRQKLG